MPESSTKPPLFTKDFLLHCLSYLFLSASFYFVLPVLPIYVVDFLQEDNRKVGFVIGIYALSALAIRPFGGYALDKYGRKPIFIASLTAFALIMAGYLLIGSFVSLMVLRTLHGLSWGNITTGGGTITADLVPEKRRGEGIGYFGLSMTLSMAVGPLFGLWIYNKNSFNGVFIAALILSTLAVIMALFVRYPSIKNPLASFEKSGIFEKRVLPISLVMLLLAIPFSAILTFITLYAQEIGIANGGSFFLVYAIGVSIIRPISGKIMDNIGPGMLMFFSFAATIIGLVLIGMATDEPFFLTAAFITGIGNGIVMPTINTMVINMVPASKRGVANATFFSSIDIGIGLGAILLGYLADSFGLANMFIICALGLLFPMAYFYIFALKDYHQKISVLTS
jgi:MFS family permease